MADAPIAQIAGPALGGPDGLGELHALFGGGAQGDIPTAEITEADLTDGVADILTLLVKSGLVPSRSEARRAVEQGGVTVDGDKVTDIKTAYGKDALTTGITLRRGKKSYKKVILK